MKVNFAAQCLRYSVADNLSFAGMIYSLKNSSIVLRQLNF
jgi:hypothetical protein